MSDTHAQTSTAAASHGETHAAPHGHHDMHLKLYWGIGGLLIFLTGFTVFLSYVDFGSIKKNIVIGLFVASFKVSLVGAIFMHLKGEKATIWRFLYFTAFFVLGLFLLTALAWYDPIFGTHTNKY